MKNIFKFLIFLVFTFVLAGFTSNVNAQTYGRTDTNSFILDKGHDLGKVIPKGYYFTPRIPYTNARGVVDQFLKNLNYPGDFYSKRNITPDLVKGKSKYFKIEWTRPYYVSSLSGIKRVLAGYLFAYRKHGNIFWMDAKNFTPAFLTGYGKKENQSIIIYPIRERRTGKIKAFVQYPCGNMVCKDTLCTDLRVTPTCGDGVVNDEIGEQCDYNDPKTKNGCTKQCTFAKLTCAVSNSKEEIYNTENPNIKIQKNSAVKIEKVYLNRTPYTSLNALNSVKLKPGIYTLNAVAINPYSGKEFLCKSSTFSVKGREYCGDGIVNLNEECDYADSSNNGSCDRTCKFKGESCSLTSKKTLVDTETKFLDIIGLNRSNTTKLIGLTINGQNISPKTFKFDHNGKYLIKATVQNPYSKKTAICEKEIIYKEREYCGDGIKNGYEKCDDGNKVNGDGCSSSCQLEVPRCDIRSNGYTFLEGQPYNKFVQIKYTGHFDNAGINRRTFFDNPTDFLTSTIKGNKCQTKNYLEYTVSNKLDPSLKKVCKLQYSIKNIESCGDGIINRNEQCDYNDPLTGPFCSQSCTFKKPEQCQLLTNTLQEGKYGTIVLENEYYATPYKAKINGTYLNASNGIFKTKIDKAGTYNFQVLIQNKLDRSHKSDKLCNFSVTVQADECKTR